MKLTIVAAVTSMARCEKELRRTICLCFGGDEGETLFVCVNHRIGRVQVATKGSGW